MHRLGPLFDCSSVAVIGASEQGYGAGPGNALRGLGFAGRWFPVNPRRTEVQGARCYPDVAAIPEAIDLAVVIVARERVIPAVAACADRGARAVVVISAGFVEADARGAALQAELAALARARGILLVGPNCFGVASVVHRCGGFTGAGLQDARRGRVAVLSNSGGLLNEVLSYGNARGIGWSHLASTGNEAGVTAADVLDFYVEDADTDVVLAILETVRDPALFVRVAEQALAARKPLVVLKLGASEKAARSALTHTGALAGSDEVYTALFRQHGIIRVADLDELIEVGSFLSGAAATLRRRPLERVAVIEISGGGKALVCDRAAAAGVELPDLSRTATETLRAAMPGGPAPSNPLDTGLTWGGEDMARLYPIALDVLASEPEVDVVLSRYSVPRSGGLGGLRGRLHELAAARAAHPDRLFAVLSRTSDQFSEEWARAIAEEDVVFLQGYGRGLRALGAVATYSRRLRRTAMSESESERGNESGTERSPAGIETLVRPDLGDRRTLTEVEAKDLLRSCGLPVIATSLARTAEDAVARARGFGHPVALKVVSPQIVHKSDQGGVHLGLSSDGAVRAAFADLRAVAASVPGAAFEGVAVQPMARPGVELVLGAHRDAQFGPVILFGLGGIFVEALRDVALRVAPLARVDALDMLDEIGGRSLLHGARGRPPVDATALADALCRLSAFMLALPWVESVDLNPVFGYEAGVLAVDARVLVSAPGVPEGSPPPRSEPASV